MISTGLLNNNNEQQSDFNERILIKCNLKELTFYQYYFSLFQIKKKMATLPEITKKSLVGNSQKIHFLFFDIKQRRVSVFGD